MTYHPARLFRALSILAAYGVLSACGGGGEGLFIGGGNGGGGGGGGNGGGGGDNQSFPIGGTVTGLGAGTVVLGNGGEQLPVSADGRFEFRTAFSTGTSYTVIVAIQPSFPAKDCTVTNGTGTMGSAAVTNVAIACAALEIPEVRVTPSAGSAQVTWSAIARAASYNIYASTRQGCDIRSATSCPDMVSVMGATSPALVTGLVSGQVYFFQVETVYTNGARGVALETSARPSSFAFNSNAYAPAPDSPLVQGCVFEIDPDGVGGWILRGAFAANGKPVVDPAVNTLALSGGTLYIGDAFLWVGKGDQCADAVDPVTGERMPDSVQPDVRRAGASARSSTSR